jgi:hypothetical protein
MRIRNYASHPKPMTTVKDGRAVGSSALPKIPGEAEAEWNNRRCSCGPCPHPTTGDIRALDKAAGFDRTALDGFSINNENWRDPRAHCSPDRGCSNQPYCAPRLGRPWAFVTGGGFHLPVSASDFGP